MLDIILIAVIIVMGFMLLITLLPKRAVQTVDEDEIDLPYKAVISQLSAQNIIDIVVRYNWLMGQPIHRDGMRFAEVVIKGKCYAMKYNLDTLMVYLHTGEISGDKALKYLMLKPMQGEEVL